MTGAGWHDAQVDVTRLQVSLSVAAGKCWPWQEQHPHSVEEQGERVDVTAVGIDNAYNRHHFSLPRWALRRA